MFFPPEIWGFLAKYLKSFKVGKIEKYDEESINSETHAFILSKILFYNNEKAEKAGKSYRNEKFSKTFEICFRLENFYWTSGMQIWQHQPKIIRPTLVKKWNFET